MSSKQISTNKKTYNKSQDGFKKKEDKSFWKWTFKKWSFWILALVHFISGLVGNTLLYDEFNLLITLRAFGIVMFFWTFIYWIFYSIYYSGYEEGKKNKA